MTGISLQVVYRDKGIPDLTLSDGHRLSRSDCEGLFKSVKFTGHEHTDPRPLPRQS
jgi:hypothetical protein